MLPKDKGQHFKSICTYWNRNKSMKGIGVGRDTHAAYRNLATHLDCSILYKKLAHFFGAVTLHIWLSF